MADQLENVAPEAVSIDPAAPAGAGKWEVSAKFLADHIGVGTRRVRELAETGQLRRTGRGLFDWHHGILANQGRIALGQERLRGLHHDTIAAAEFLTAFMVKGGCPVTPADIAIWHATCARWGVSSDDAGALLANAASLLGERAPRFETSTEGKN